MHSEVELRQSMYFVEPFRKGDEPLGIVTSCVSGAEDTVIGLTLADGFGHWGSLKS